MNPPTASTPIDYPSFARNPAPHRNLPTNSNSGVTNEPPYKRRQLHRYAFPTTSHSIPQKTAAIASSPPAIAGDALVEGIKIGRTHIRVPRKLTEQIAELDAPLISLEEEFARLRQGQQEAGTERRPRLHRPKRPILTAFFSVAAVVLVIAGILVGPVIYRGTRAYQNIFEDPVPHDEVPFTVAINPEGTPVIVESTATTSASIPQWDGKDRVTILLLGIDRREEEFTRSDTMILVNIDPVNNAASMLSIPRDLKVVIPGYGVHKMNSSYAFGDEDNLPGGGPGLTIRTIEANFGIRVNYYAQVDFDGFISLIDLVGGVTLDVPYPIKDDEYPGPGNQYMRLFFKPGWQHMDGERALQYARTRHDDGDGRRSARQQQVLMALRQQAISLDLLPKAAELLEELGDAVRTDLQPKQALQLAQLASQIDPASIVSYSLDNAVWEQQLEGQPYYLIADWDAVGTIMSEFTGTEVIPPMSLLANPNYSIEILVEDGTFNPGLGGRVKDVLNGFGFANVTVVDKADLGNYPVSSLTTDTDNLTTAYLVASLLGLELDSIEVNDDPMQSPTATAEGVATENLPPESATSESTIEVVPLFPTATGGTAAEESTGEAQPGHMVIVIGDDAPDPSYYTSELYTEEVLPVENGATFEDDGSDTGAEDETSGE